MKRFVALCSLLALVLACTGGGASQSAQPTSAPAPSAQAARPAASPAAGPSPRASASPAAAAPSGPLTTVKYGQLTPPSASDSGMLIAQAKGWFRDEGINLDVVAFDTAAKMIAPLGTNQIDAGGGSLGAGLFNAVARKVPVTIVADKGTTSPGHGYLGVVVRKALMDSGKVKSVADLKGKKIALSSTAIAPEAALADLLKQGGLTIKDVQIVPMPFPDMVVALGNGSIDAAEPIEPFLTDEVTKGVGVLFKRADTYSPSSQNAVVLYSPSFAAKKDLATRFMVAYLRGVRMYDDAFDKKNPAARAEAIQILSKATALKDPALFDKVAMPGLDPNGAVNMANLQSQQAYYLAQGEQTQQVDLSKVVNMSFVQAAAQQLGPYQK